MRFDLLVEQRAKIVAGQKANMSLQEIESEIQHFHGGPPEAASVGSSERQKWFEGWLREVSVDAPPQQQQVPSIRRACVAPIEELKPAVEKHVALKWDDKMSAICGCVGDVLIDDSSDNTSKI